MGPSAILSTGGSYISTLLNGLTSFAVDYLGEVLWHNIESIDGTFQKLLRYTAVHGVLILSYLFLVGSSCNIHEVVR